MAVISFDFAGRGNLSQRQSDLFRGPRRSLMCSGLRVDVCPSCDLRSGFAVSMAKNLAPPGPRSDSNHAEKQC